MAYAGVPSGDTTGTVRDSLIRENLLDVVTMISPQDTPWLSTLAKMLIHDTQVYFVTDILGDSGDPANGNADVQSIAEDADADFPAPEVGPYRIYNRAHGFRELVSMSDILAYVNTVDTDNLYATRLAKKIRLQAMKMEYALYHSIGQAAVGSGGADSPGQVNPQMFGFRQIGLHSGFTSEGQWNTLPDDAQGTDIDVSDSPAKHLLETHLGDLMEQMYDKGARATDLWLSVRKKRELANFEAASVRNINSADRMLINTVDVYESPVGVVIANLHPKMPNSEIMATQTDLLKIGVLMPTIPQRLAKIGGSIKGMVTTWLTNLPLAPAAIGISRGFVDTYETVVETTHEQSP